MSEWKQKRFWKEATVAENADGFTVLLDGRGLKTPAKATLLVPTHALAAEIAAEWDAQEEVVDPLSMPFTRTANAAVDKVAFQHAEVADMLAAYGDSDLLCYRADTPEELVARQAALWDPALEWAKDALGVTLEARAGLMHVPQNPEALGLLSGHVHRLSVFELAAFHDLVSLSGSLILGFAAALDWRDADAIWTLSRLDELWQLEQWGKDEEAEEMAEHKRQALLHAKRVYDMSNPATT